MLRSAVIVVVLLVLMGSLVKQPAAPALAAGQNQPAAGPIPVRNERPRSGQEVLVLRHQQLRKGAHDAYRLARYASFDHWRATRDPVNAGIGGNGGDRRAWRDALAAQAKLARDTTEEIMLGEMYGSPPVFMPALAERYRLAR